MKYNIPTDYTQAHMIDRDSTIKVDLKWNETGVKGRLQKVKKTTGNNENVIVKEGSIFRVSAFSESYGKLDKITYSFEKDSQFEFNGKTITLEKDMRLQVDVDTLNHLSYELLNMKIVPKLGFGDAKFTELHDNIYVSVASQVKFIEHKENKIVKPKNEYRDIKVSSAWVRDDKYNSLGTYTIKCDFDVEEDLYKEEIVNKNRWSSDKITIKHRQKIKNLVFKVYYEPTNKGLKFIGERKNFTSAVRKANEHNMLEQNPALKRQKKFERILGDDE